MSGFFPRVRMRRNRKNQAIRDLIAETKISASDLILPIFVTEGNDVKEEIKTMPGVFRFSINQAIEEIKIAQDLGIQNIMLFPNIDQSLKSLDASEAINPDNLICKSINKIHNLFPNINIISDVALDPYTAHGHDGLVNQNGEVDNDLTIELLCRQALIQAMAGSSIVAPSDMMDGRIGKVRDFLDYNKREETSIMSYGVKYASNLYGPFRDAVGSKGNIKSANKKTYQMDFRNSKEAVREALLDESEGADFIIIKPAIFYLDIIKEVTKVVNMPIVAYQVSGEYAMLRFATNHDAFDFDSVLMESLIAIRRAGANAIITYGAIRAAMALR